jgi:2-oxoglutarate ferredoxin oxidoreductase subunit alpha
VRKDWFSPPIDQSPWKAGIDPYHWDEQTGLSKRPIVGQKGGIYTLTGLAHTREATVSYTPETNQEASEMRSRKLATFGQSLKPPKILGDESGDLLLVGWGSTKGAIDEAVDRLRSEGLKVSAIHLRFLSPLEPGLKELFQRFKKVRTVEINYSDQKTDSILSPASRRYAQLAWVLRAHTLIDIDSFSSVHGHPLHPKDIVTMAHELLHVPETLNT